MIDRLELGLRRLRRRLSRSHWTGRWLGLPAAAHDGLAPGLLLIQIDGLGRGVLLRALASGRMPFLAGLLERQGYRLHPLYAGVPSTTPVMQAELFYGVPCAVPGFSFCERKTRRLVFMYEHDAARRVQERIDSHPQLLAGGSAYCDVYTGGAADARFCMSSMGWGDFFRSARPSVLPLLAVLHAPALLGASARMLWEAGRALFGLREGVRGHQDLRAESKFLAARLGVGIALTEMVVIGAKVDLARGLPVLHLNLLGYDEHAHRRGPASASALAALRQTDRSIARLVRAARRSPLRDYEVWVYADHGQEETIPYCERYGRSIQEAVAAVFRDQGIEPGQPRPASPRGVEGQRTRLLGEQLLRTLAPGMAAPAPPWEPGTLAVAAQGPLGHVYAPRALRPRERDAVAAALVRDAAVPLVLAKEDDLAARAWTERGCFRLPDQAAEVLGAGHRHLAWAARDLAALCHHPDAGDLVLSGWRPDGPAMSFPHENGAHGGPGPDETDAFALLPSDTPLPVPELRRAEPEDVPTLRTRDLRRAAFTVLDRAGERVGWSRSHRARPARSLRIVTYNVHSCIGMDGHASPERIARVLARLDPDVVALQELDVGRARTGGVDQAEAIAVALEMELHFLTTLQVEEERFGDAVLSRLPMRLVHAGPLPRLPGRPRLEPRGALWVEIDAHGERLQLVNTHLSLHHRERSLQVAALLGPEWLGHPACRSPRILCGDLNALPFFPVCRRLGRVLRDCQADATVRRPQRTFAGGAPLGRIDHVFVEPSLRILGVEVPRTELTRVASDHLPLVVDVSLAGEPSFEPSTRER